MLALVPGGADAQLGPAARQHVEGRDGLGQEAGMAIGHPGHEEPQPEPLRATGDEAERRVTLEHRVLRRRHPVHLEVVVHERQGAHPDGLGPLGQVGHTRSYARRTAGPVESRNVEIELHARRSSTTRTGSSR